MMRHNQLYCPCALDDLPVTLRNTELTMDTFCKHLKTVLFTDSWGRGAFVTLWYYRAVYQCPYLLTYLLTYIKVPHARAVKSSNVLNCPHDEIKPRGNSFATVSQLFCFSFDSFCGQFYSLTRPYNALLSVFLLYTNLYINHFIIKSYSKYR